MFTSLSRFILENTDVRHKVVAVHHWYTGDPCIVSVKESAHGKVLVSHDIEGQPLYGCPDWWVNTYDVIGPVIGGPVLGAVTESNDVLKFKKKREGMFDAAYFGDKGSAIRYRFKRYSDINNGNSVCEMHIDIHPDEQGKGLAQKMLKSFIAKFNYVLWFSHGRILNENVYKVIDKFRSDNDYTVIDYEDGITIQMSKGITESNVISGIADIIEKELKKKHGIYTVKNADFHIIFDIAEDVLELTWITINSNKYTGKEVLLGIIDYCQQFNINKLRATGVRGEHHKKDSYGYYVMLKWGFIPDGGISFLNDVLGTKYESIEQAYADPEFWNKWKKDGTEFDGTFDMSAGSLSKRMFDDKLSHVKTYTPDPIDPTNMTDNDVFVFGSNTEGRHSGGAAKAAVVNYGAIMGQARGMQGRSYAIVTIDYTGKLPVTLESIGEELDTFIDFAKENPDKRFWMTKIGTGISKIPMQSIISLFKKRTFPTNVVLPIEFS